MLSARIDKAGWSWGCVAAVDFNGRIIFVADAHRGEPLKLSALKCVSHVEEAAN